MRQFKLQKNAVRMALVAAALLAVTAMPALAGNAASYVPNEYIMHAIPGTPLATVEAAVARMGCTLVGPIALEDSYLVKMSGNRNNTGIWRSGLVTGSSVSAVASVPWVIDRVQPNFLKRPMATPNDALWDKMWGLVQIRMPAAWDITKGSSSVVVAVNDTGVADNHPDLIGRVLPGYDFIDNDPDANPEYIPDPPNDPDGEGESHGTHVSGTVAAQGNNSIGVCGVCWEGVNILPVRVGTSKSGMPSDALINGLDYSMKNGADVVNMSYGGYYDDPAFHTKLKQLAAAGIILVASAGNDHTSVPSYPASYEEVVSVAATGPYEAPAFYSNFGHIDIAAPGGDSTFGADGCIMSTVVTWPGGNRIYGYLGDMWQGTSMAAPHVSGAVALMLSYGIPRTEVVDRMLSSARPPKSGGTDALYYGAGILDVMGALSSSALRVVEPTKGGNVAGVPHFRISVRGILLSSIKVYLDYADLDDNGVPDNPSDSQIINSTNVNYFWDATAKMIVFDWLDTNLHLPQGSAALKAGVHKVYVTGTASAGVGTASDWSAFFVITKSISKGIHLVSFPYALNDRVNNTPSVVLPGARFRASDRPRSTLIRWIGAPKSATNSAPIGYKTYIPGTLLDQTWVTPSYISDGASVLLGGGYYHDTMTGSITAASPVGSGFWLILPQDVYVDETFPTLESQFDFDSSKGFDIPIYAGWNLIGNPYAHEVPWRGALFTYKGRMLSLLDAESAGWIRSAVYGYGGSNVGYVRVSDRDTLQPYNGYWILALVGGITDSESLVMSLLP